jgi:cardiolipin synthase
MPSLKAWIPNLLTFSRFPLSVAFYVLAVRHALAEALLLFFLTQTTDWLDGPLARQWNVQTKLGTVVEHLADAFMLSMVGLALTQVGVIPAWLYVGGLVYCISTWVAPGSVRRLAGLNVLLGMRTLLYGTALAVIPFMVLRRIAREEPLLALAVLIAFIVYGAGALYWKRGRIFYHWGRFRSRISSRLMRT